MRFLFFLSSLFLSSLFVLCTASASAQFGGDGASKSSLVAGVKSVVPGGRFTVALELTHADGWHSYYVNPGAIGEPVSFSWELPEGAVAGAIQFPIPHKATAQGVKGRVTLYGYEGRNVFLVEIKVPDDVEAGSTFDFKATARWLVCNDTGCRPESASFSMALPVAASAEANPEGAKLIAEAAEHLPADGKGLSVAVSEMDDEISLTVGLPAEVKKLSSAYFFSADKQIDAQQGQGFDFSEGRVVLTLKRNLGNKANFIDSGPKLATLSGVLVVESGGDELAFLVKGDFEGVAKSQPEVVGAVPVVDAEVKPSGQWTEADIAEGTALYDADARPKFVLLDGGEEKKLTLLPALGLVFIGGLLLNLMPCVFPVLGLKIMGFVQQAGEDERKVKRHGMVFGFGVVVSMWILSGIIVAAGLNWGAQLQSPVFVAGIVILLFLMGLNLAGVFEFGTSATGVGSGLQAKKGYSGSFFSGVLTTLIATPCSGPFLGAVMGFALAQKAPIALLIFTMFALGIASPYIVLSFFPKLINKLPKPGAWMEHFKKGMSFALFATVVFFLGTFASQTGYSGLSWLLFALVVIALAAWIYGTWGTPFQSKKLRIGVGYGLTAIIGLLGIQMTRIAVTKEAPILAGGDDWKPWFPGAMEVTRAKKRIAWIDYTADW